MELDTGSHDAGSENIADGRRIPHEALFTEVDMAPASSGPSRGATVLQGG
jgi:hypothetical protein